MGMWLRLMFCLTLRVRVRPSMPGIITSVSRRSGASLHMAWNADSPLENAVTRNISLRLSRRYWRTSASSSAMYMSLLRFFPAEVVSGASGVISWGAAIGL